MDHDPNSPQRTALVVACADSQVKGLVSKVLSSWKVEYARDNNEALVLAEKSLFDIVVTDETSSGQEGVELLRRLRLVRPHARLIILANKRSPADVIAAIRERAFSYFSMPLSTQAFEEALQLAMKSSAWEETIEILSGTDAWLRLSVRCDVPTANRLHQFVGEFLDLPEGDEDKVATACREMLLNAMEHGGRV